MRSYRIGIPLLVVTALFAGPVQAGENNDIIVGQWNGGSGYQVTAGRGDASFREKNIELTLVIDQRRRVVGVSSGNGCSFVGEYRQTESVVDFPLKGQLNGCNYQGLNTRYTGTLHYDPAKRSVAINLEREEIPTAGKIIRYTIVGMLQRVPVTK